MSGILAAAIAGLFTLAGLIWVNRRLNRLQARRLDVETTAEEVAYLRNELKATREDVALARAEAAEAKTEAHAARAEAAHVHRILEVYRLGTLRLIDQIRTAGLAPCWSPPAPEEVSS